MEDKLLELLNKKDQIIINILRKISEKNIDYSLLYLSEEFNFSTRTILRYVADLDDYVNCYNQDKKKDFELIHNKKGIQLVISDEANINFLISFIFQKNDTIKLLKSLLIQKHDSLNDYKIANYESTISINNSIDKISKFLDPYNLNINRIKFSIEGLESSIRLLMQNVFWLTCRCDEFPSEFQMLDKHLLNNNMQYIIEIFSINYQHSIKIKDLKFRLCITLIRYQKKNIVYLNEKQKQNIPIYKNDFGRPSLYEAIESILNTHRIYNHEEIYFLTYSFLMNSLIYTDKSIKNKIFQHHVLLETDVYKSTLLFLDEFQQEICQIPHEKLNDIFEFIFKTHLIASLDSAELSDYNSYIFEKIRYQTPGFIEKISLIIEKLSNRDIHIFDEKKYLLNRYSILGYSLNMMLLKKKTITILLNTDFPDAYEKFIREHLVNLYKNKYKILFIEDIFYRNYDLLLTSYYSEKEKVKNILNISYPLTQREIQSLDSKLEEISNDS
ncbi:helix-turn-helix domain-containing protein [Enterococcus sulfureus]